MPREIDDAWIEEAIASYQRIEQRQAAYAKALAGVEVTVRSPDGLIEVAVGADGGIRDVRVVGDPSGRGADDLTRAIRQAVTSAHDAAGWARRKVHEESFGEYEPLGRAR